MEQPVWKPGEGVPAEPLGSGVVVAEPTRYPTPAPPSRITTPPPVRRSVPRPPVAASLLADRPPWLIPAAVAVIIVLLLGIVGFKVLSGRSTGNPVAHTSPTAHPTATPHGAPTPTASSKTPQAVPTTYGPASADPVKSIQICSQASPCNIPGSSAETGSSCDLSSSCKLEVALYFTSVQKSTDVSYIIKFFDRCTGQTTDLPGAATKTPSTGFIVAIPTDHLAVTIPSGVKSGALVAVSQSPAVAASQPLLLGSGTSCA